MPVKNKLNEVLAQRLGCKITPYRLTKMTGLAQLTARSAMNNPDWYPDKNTTEIICRVFGIQPGDFLFFTEDEAMKQQ